LVDFFRLRQAGFNHPTEESIMRCCCPRTLNLNRRKHLNTDFGEHNERDNLTDTGSGPLRGPAEKAAFLADLRHAARDIGFFYLINHGVDESLQQAVQQQSRAFLPCPTIKSRGWQ
jgi:hypothetical protein